MFYLSRPSTFPGRVRQEAPLAASLPVARGEISLSDSVGCTKRICMAGILSLGLIPLLDVQPVLARSPIIIDRAPASAFGERDVILTSTGKGPTSRAYLQERGGHAYLYLQERHMYSAAAGLGVCLVD